MNPWTFIAGAYAVTAIVLLAEVVALWIRRRAALASLRDDVATPAAGERSFHHVS